MQNNNLINNLIIRKHIHTYIYTNITYKHTNIYTYKHIFIEYTKHIICMYTHNYLNNFMQL